MADNPNASSSVPSSSCAATVVHERRWRLDRRVPTDPPLGLLDRVRQLVDAEVDAVEAKAEIERVEVESESADGLVEDVHLRVVGRDRS